MVRRLMLILLTLAAPALAAAQSDSRYYRHRPGEPAVGPTFSGWIGVGAPGGRISNEGDGALGDVVSHEFAFGFGAAYRLSPLVRVGTFFEAAPLAMADNACAPGDSCGGTDVRFGFDAQLHLAPYHRADPWIGIGVGYEWLGFDATACDSGGCFPEHWQYSGWLFPRLSAGIDFALTPVTTLGPYISYSGGQFADVHTNSAGSQSIGNQAFHGWLELGIRGNLNL